ncbi:PAS domain S-box protein [bacterium]|nr:PAS domain S-box protein [bacterium]
MKVQPYGDTHPNPEGKPGPAIFSLSHSGVVQDANLAALNLCGYTVQELRSTQILDLLHFPPGRSAPASHLHEQWQHETPQDRLLQHKDGTLLQVSWSTSQLEYAGAKTILAVVQKIESPTPNVLQAIFKQSLNAIMVANETGRYTSVNQAAAEMFGYTIDQMLNMSVADILTPYQPDAATRYAEYVITGREIGEFEFLHAGGEQRIAAYHAVRISENAHLSVLADVTEHKRTQKELRESEARLRALFHAIPLPTYTWQKVDDDFVLTGYNDVAVSTTKGHIASLAGTRATELYRDDPQIVSDLHQCYEDRSTIERVTSYVMRSTGEPKTINVRYAYVPGDMVMALVEDITERKQAEELLRKLSQVVEQSPTSIIITDANGAIDYVNPKFCELTGYTLEEALGQNPRILKSGLHSPEFYAQLWTTIESGQTWGGELRNQKKNGELYWEYASIAGVKDADGNITHYIAVKEDITEQKRLDEQSTRQERLAAVGHLAAGIAHDFNNILGVIVIYAQMLSRSPKMPDGLSDKATVIYQQAQHAAHLVQQILDFGRRGNMEIQPLNLVPLLKEQIRLLQRTLPENIQIKLTYSNSELLLNADPTRMQQILTNIAINARDAMPDGGRLHFDLAKVHFGANDPLPYVGMKLGEWLKLSISDTGTGMSEEVTAHLFEPFFTTKERGRGTGLGLAQVYGIVKKHDGFIVVNSRLDMGSTFDLYFPALPQLQDKKATVIADLEKVDGASHTILLVEDDKVLRKVLGELLTGWNYRVIDAEDGMEAQQILADDRIIIDLVLSDVIMPNLGGIELAGEIRRHFPHLPIVLISGHIDSGEATKFEALGLQSPLPKPLDSVLLANILNEQLRPPTTL